MLRLASYSSLVPKFEPKETPPTVGKAEKRGTLLDRLGLKSIDPVLEREAREYMRVWGITFEQALKAVLARRGIMDEQLKKVAGDMFTGGSEMKRRVIPRVVGEYVHRETMKLMGEGGGDYWACFHEVLNTDKELKSLYTGITTQVTHGPEIKPSAQSGRAAGSELDALTRQFMVEMNVDDYEWALKQVMKANPSLTKRYTQS